MIPDVSTSSRPRARRGLTALLLLPLLLVLAGCFRLDMGITINEDETADMSIEVGDLTGIATREDMDCVALESQLAGTADVDFTAEDIEDADGNLGCRISATDAPLDTLAQGGGMTIERTEDTYRFSFEGDPAGMGDLSQFQDTPGGEPEVSISVTFPGEVVEADGEVDGNTVTWTGVEAFAAGGSATGEATGSVIGGDGATILWIVLGVIALLAIAALIFFLVRKRGRGEAAPGDAATPYGGPADPYRQPGQVPADPGAGYPAQPGQPAQPGAGYGPPDQVPTDPGPGYPGQQQAPTPDPATTAAADTPVARPEDSGFGPESPGGGDVPPEDPRPQAPDDRQPPR